MIKIYVIFHKTFENTNLFTTDKNKVFTIIERMENKYEETKGEWNYREITEEEEFEADVS
jgi:hypothetical protein